MPIGEFAAGAIFEVLVELIGTYLIILPGAIFRYLFGLRSKHPKSFRYYFTDDTFWSGAIGIVCIILVICLFWIF